MTDIVVRAAEPSDAEAVHEILSCPKVIANTLQLPWRSLEERRERVGRGGEGRHSLVAVVDGRVVGNLGLDLEATPRRRDVGSIGMAVHDDFAGRGVGSALMAAAIELADDWLGLRRLELTVYADNAAAVHLYEKFGFRIEGTGIHYARRAGELVDAYFMARLHPHHSSKTQP
jgi:putative acetyltransferase